MPIVIIILSILSLVFIGLYTFDRKKCPKQNDCPKQKECPKCKECPVCQGAILTEQGQQKCPSCPKCPDCVKLNVQCYRHLSDEVAVKTIGDFTEKRYIHYLRQ